jgi:hypothetical protein
MKSISVPKVHISPEIHANILKGIIKIALTQLVFEYTISKTVHMIVSVSSHLHTIIIIPVHAVLLTAFLVQNLAFHVHLVARFGPITVRYLHSDLRPTERFPVQITDTIFCINMIKELDKGKPWWIMCQPYLA